MVVFSLTIFSRHLRGMANFLKQLVFTSFPDNLSLQSSVFHPLSSNIQHYHTDDCLEDNKEDYQNYHYVNYIIHVYNGVYSFRFSLFFLYFVFCVSVKVKLTVQLLCVCVHSAWKGRPQNDLYCVGWDVKSYLLTHSFSICLVVNCSCNLTRFVMEQNLPVAQSKYFRVLCSDGWYFADGLNG